MYPQSLHTHSPSQYIAAFSASAFFCAFDFLVPKTFRLVLVISAGLTDVAVGGETKVGRATKADVVENDKQSAASIVKIREENVLIVAV